jgi:hypothetical protein
MVSGCIINVSTRSWRLGACLVALYAVCGAQRIEESASAQQSDAAQPITGVLVTPGTRQAAVAAQLKGMAPGARVIVMRGFADDIASRDTIRITALSPTTRRPSTLTVQSPWLDRGIASASARIDSWMRTLARQGAQVDAVEVLAVDSGIAERLSKLTHPHIRAIAADRRYAGLMSQNPELLDIASVIDAGPSDSPWSRAMGRQVSGAVLVAHERGAAQAFPRAAVRWWAPTPPVSPPTLASATASLPAEAKDPPTQASSAPTGPDASPTAAAPASGNSSGLDPSAKGGVAAATSSAGEVAGQAAPDLALLTQATRAKANEALSAVPGARRTYDWNGPLSYRAREWAAIFERARDSVALRQQLMALAIGAKANFANADPSLYRRPNSLAEIHPSQLNSSTAAAGPNGEVFALAMADCSQSDFLRHRGVELAISAAYLGDTECIAKCIDMLAAFKDRFPLQRPGWTLYEPSRAMPEGGDGVWLGTGWGITGIVDMLTILGDRVPASLQADLRVLLRKEVNAISRDWADKRPWFVKSRAVQSNQWIEPCVGLIKATLFLGDPDLLPAYNLGVENLAMSLELQGSDGAFREGFSYAAMTAGPLFSALDDLRMNGDLRCQAMPFVANCWIWLTQMIMPGRQFVNTFDSRMSAMPAWTISTPHDATVSAAFSSGDPRAVPVLRTLFPRGDTSIPGIRYLAALEATPPSAPAYLPTFGYFPSQQQVVWRSSWEAPSAAQSALGLFVRGGSRLDSHAQRDQGQVSIYNGDRIVLMEAGTPDYSTPDFNDRYARAAGHGIMQFGELQPRSLAVDSPIDVRRLDASGGHVVVNTTAAYTGVSLCQREVAWSASGNITISDKVRLAQAAAPGSELYRFHTGASESVSIEPVKGGWTVSWPGATLRIYADTPIVVEQVQWPDAVKAPFMHQAILIRVTEAVSSLDLHTEIVVDRGSAAVR